MPKKEIEKEPINVTIDIDIKKDIQEIAQKKRMPLSVLVNIIFADYLESLKDGS